MRYRSSVASVKIPRVLVMGDWDADGIAASALILYAQEKVGVYPLNTKALVDLKPLDPEKLRLFIKDVKHKYNALVFLDIPYIPRMENIFRILKEHYSVEKIVFIDHHISSLNNEKKLKEIVDELHLAHEPTSMIVYKILLEKNIHIPSRLKMFVETISYMDRGLRVPEKYMKLFELASLFSKALTVKRDEKIWVELVKWLSNPMPIQMPLNKRVLDKIKKAVEERDKELKDIAMDLALTARKAGYIKFIDARRVWRKRGATALASKIAHILKSPVAVLFTTNRGYDLLVIKASSGIAYRIAKYLIAEGFAEDVAGHPNLAIVRLKQVDVEELVKALNKACFYT